VPSQWSQPVWTNTKEVVRWKLRVEVFQKDTRVNVTFSELKLNTRHSLLINHLLGATYNVEPISLRIDFEQVDPTDPLPLTEIVDRGKGALYLLWFWTVVKTR
jgi:hypothetical protein